METRFTNVLSAGNPYNLLVITDGILSMKKHTIIFLCIKLFCICLCTELSANPFTGNKNTGSTLRSEKPPEFIVQQQSLLRTKLGDALYEWANTNTARTFWTIIWVAFFYGFMHALGPGHRKTLVFSFYLSKKAPVWEPAVTSFILVALHSVTSIALLLVFHNVSGTLSAHTDAAAEYLEDISYLLLIVLSIASLVHLLSHAFPHKIPHFQFRKTAQQIPVQGSAALSKQPEKNSNRYTLLRHNSIPPAAPQREPNTGTHAYTEKSRSGTHTEQGYTGTALRYTRTAASQKQHSLAKVQWGTFLLSGLYPCPASVLVLVLVSSLRTAGIGVVAILSISAGMAVPVTAAAYLGWSGRQRLFKRIPKTQTYLERTALALGFAAYCIILVFSLTGVIPFIRSIGLTLLRPVP